MRWCAALIAAVLVGGCSSAAPPAARPSPSQQAAAGAPSGEPAGKKKPPRNGKPAAAPSPAVPAPSTRDPASLSPAQARTTAELARILTAAETAVRNPAVRGKELARAGHTQQRVYRLLLRRPQWRGRVLANVTPALRPAARRNLAASISLASLVMPQRELPDWRIVSPAPAPELLRAYRRAASEFGLQWEYLAAINLVETRMGRIRGRSTAGAQGPMQFMPQTWDAYGRGDINDPHDAITAAARYLAASGAPDDMAGALYAYNHSDAYVAAVTAYAEVLFADPRAYRGYYHWQVYYSTPRGDVRLPVGYGS